MKKVFIILLLLFSFGKSYSVNPNEKKKITPLCETRALAMNRLSDFFKSYDTTILKVLFSIPSDETNNQTTNPNIEYMINKNRELISILSSINPDVYKPENLNVSDDLIVFAGAIELYTERKSRQINTNYVPVDCIKNVILGFFDVVSLIEDYVALIKTGGNWATVRSLIFRTLKRYAGWIAAANLIYEIATECY
ncbi:MAG: hypothetical protein WKF35_01615 [Ferruginibacter sp.]